MSSSSNEIDKKAILELTEANLIEILSCLYPQPKPIAFQGKNIAPLPDREVAAQKYLEGKRQLLNELILKTTLGKNSEQNNSEKEQGKSNAFSLQSLLLHRYGFKDVSEAKSFLAEYSKNFKENNLNCETILNYESHKKLFNNLLDQIKTYTLNNLIVKTERSPIVGNIFLKLDKICQEVEQKRFRPASLLLSLHVDGQIEIKSFVRTPIGWKAFIKIKQQSQATEPTDERKLKPILVEQAEPIQIIKKHIDYLLEEIEKLENLSVLDIDDLEYLYSLIAVEIPTFISDIPAFNIRYETNVSYYENLKLKDSELNKFWSIRYKSDEGYEGYERTIFGSLNKISNIIGNLFNLVDRKKIQAIVSAELFGGLSSAQKDFINLLDKQNNDDELKRAFYSKFNNKIDADSAHEIIETLEGFYTFLSAAEHLDYTSLNYTINDYIYEDFKIKFNAISEQLKDILVTTPQPPYVRSCIRLYEFKDRFYVIKDKPDEIRKILKSAKKVLETIKNQTDELSNEILSFIEKNSKKTQFQESDSSKTQQMEIKEKAGKSKHSLKITKNNILLDHKELLTSRSTIYDYIIKMKDTKQASYQELFDQKILPTCKKTAISKVNKKAKEITGDSNFCLLSTGKLKGYYLLNNSVSIYE